MEDVFRHEGDVDFKGDCRTWLERRKLVLRRSNSCSCVLLHGFGVLAGDFDGVVPEDHLLWCCKQRFLITNILRAHLTAA